MIAPGAVRREAGEPAGPRTLPPLSAPDIAKLQAPAAKHDIKHLGPMRPEPQMSPLCVAIDRHWH